MQITTISLSFGKCGYQQKMSSCKLQQCLFDSAKTAKNKGIQVRFQSKHALQPLPVILQSTGKHFEQC
jgi:hypothetical protein